MAEAVPSRLGPPAEQGRAGLSAEQAHARLDRYGPNTVPARPPEAVRRRIARQLRDPLIVVLLVAAILTLATGDYSDAVIVLVVVVVNSTVGVVQEVRAESAVRALSALSAPAARVRRDGAVLELPSSQVVPGDVVLIGEGDIVPADGLLLEAAALLVDESMLTGESVPAVKQAASPGGSGNRSGQPEQRTVSAGTIVVRGRGVVLVTATGSDGAMGRIAAMLTGGPALTPLQRRLVRLGRALAAAAVLLCLLVMVSGLLRGEPLELMAITAVSLVVAAVPESLPAVVTLSLALGASRMAARNAIVRRLPAVETLGSVTVIALDKTGTLTEGRMVAQRLWTPVGGARITGSGYGPLGEVIPGPDAARPDAARPDAARPNALRALLRAAALCTDAELRPPGGARSAAGEWHAIGDPTEAALLAAAGKLGLSRDELTREFPRVAELPFDSGRRRMTTVHRVTADPDGSVEVICKGAPESVLRAPLLADASALLTVAAARAASFADEGYRVLAVASRTLARQPLPDELERGLHLLGLVAIADPPRAAAAATLQACRAAGITPVLITGDHRATARAVAVQLGIIGPDDPVAGGEQLRAGALPDPTRVRVYARTSPEQKLDIVRAWRQAGHVVAMTGDGVNDGPALLSADIGVAMGGRGTEVARQSADLVLADDDLATVIGAVQEGRRVYANVRRFLLYGLSGGTAEILVMLAGPFLGLALPLLPAQILWINLVTHGLPGVALGAEPVEPDAMDLPPRPPAESVLGDGLGRRIVRSGVVIAATALAAGTWAHATGRPWQTLLFVTLALAQLGLALGSGPGR